MATQLDPKYKQKVDEARAASKAGNLASVPGKTYTGDPLGTRYVSTPYTATKENPIQDTNKRNDLPSVVTKDISETQFGTEIPKTSGIDTGFVNSLGQSLEEQSAIARKGEIETQYLGFKGESEQARQRALGLSQQLSQRLKTEASDTLRRSMAIRGGLRGSFAEGKLMELENLYNERLNLEQQQINAQYDIQQAGMSAEKQKLINELDNKINALKTKAKTDIVGMLTGQETPDELKIIATKYGIDPVELALKTRSLQQIKQTEQQKIEAVNRDKAFDNLLSLAGTGINITADIAKALFQGTGVTDYGNLALMAGDISKMKGEERQLGIDKLNAEIARIKADSVQKKEAEYKETVAKWEAFSKMYEKDPELAKAFANKIGITVPSLGEASEGDGSTLVNITQFEDGSKIEEAPDWRSYTGMPEECGGGVNYATKTRGFMRDTYNEKKDDAHAKVKGFVSTSLPQVGSIFVSNTGVKNGNTDPGHCGVITGVSKDSNGNVTGVDTWEVNGVGTPDVVSRNHYSANDLGYKSMTKFYTKGSKASRLSDVDITKFNDTKFDINKVKGVEKEKFINFVDEKNRIMSDPNANLEDILKYSKGGKDLTDTPINQLSKYNNTLSNLQEIQGLIAGQETGPIIGRLKALNPYDVNAQALEASLNAIIPNLARGVYGEVGVLTDNDIALYRKTLPNLASTREVGNAVLALTLRKILNGYKGILQAQGASNRDVSGFIGAYKNIQKQVDSIEQSLQHAPIQPAYMGETVGRWKSMTQGTVGRWQSKNKK